MSKKYQRIIEKTNKKARKRVKIPQTVQDYMTNLTLDLRGIQNSLVKIDTAKWQIYQAFDALKQIIRILRRKKLLGKYEDWEDLMCDDCKFKNKVLDILIETETMGTIKGEGEEKEVVFNKEDWDELIKKMDEVI